jgi:hypothetical protein
MSDEAEGTGATSVDAQFTTVQVLKPFNGFEAVYQGKPASTPIAIPGGRDPRAGQPGYDPNLIEGIPVPLGSRIILWIPQTPNPQQGSQEYAYRVVWRYRNLSDYRNPGRVDIARPPFHIPRQTPGAPDTTVGTQQRVVIPASYRVVADEQTEAPLTDGRVNLHVEDVAIVGQQLIDVVRPLLPDGSVATIQQGILDPATNPVPAPVPLFLPFQFDAEGDEMLIFAVRATLSGSPPPPWDFTSPNGADFPFSNIYGTGGGTHANFAEVGILMVTGTNP